MVTIGDVISTIEECFPLSYQESYDNSGLQVGDVTQPLRGIMLSVETTEAVLEECVMRGCNLLVSHHPILFRGLKRLSTATYQERCVAFALRNNIAIYACHTSADNETTQGVNHYLANLIGLEASGRRPMMPQRGRFYKLQTYIPHSHADALRTAYEETGIGSLGGYTGCSYSCSGVGRFRPGAETHPTIGTHGALEAVEEEMVSVLVPEERLSQALATLRAAHPYEVPAYEVIPIVMDHPTSGLGVVGTLPSEMAPQAFLEHLAQIPGVERIAYSNQPTQPIRRVALCGGSGGGHEFIREAIRSGADVYITGEAKYNDYLDVQGRLWLITFGHFESELCARTMLYDALSDKYRNFVIHTSDADTNPIHYF